MTNNPTANSAVKHDVSLKFYDIKKMKKLETLKMYQRDKNYHNNTSARWQ